MDGKGGKGTPRVTSHSPALMLRTLPLALVDLTRRPVMLILIRSLLVTLAIFAGLGLVVGWALDGSDPCAAWSGESCALGAGESGLGALLLTALAVWLLFPAIALGVIAAYSDRIVAAVEGIHYPASARIARPLSYGGAALLGLRSAGRLLLYNLVALPFYLVLLVTGIGPIILFVLVNGVAIGRDFGEMVAARHGDSTSRHLWLRDTRGERAAIGIITTAAFMVPVINLIAPVLGAAMATHLLHGGTVPMRHPGEVR